MSYFLWHTITDMSANLLGILDEEKDDRTQNAANWNYQLRLGGSEVNRTVSYPLWPNARFASGDPAVGVAYLFGSDQGGETNSWDGWTVFNGGTYRPGYLMGKVTQSDGVTPLAAAVVVLALSSTDQFVSQGITDQNGNYMLPTPFAGQNHYIYGNYAGGTFVGGSVNTLTPNF